jgi:hypothetical protein
VLLLEENELVTVFHRLDCGRRKFELFRASDSKTSGYVSGRPGGKNRVQD